METNRERSLDTLNDLLRGELSAVETYRQAIDKLEGSDEPIHVEAELRECCSAHESRVSVLQREIKNQGGKPADSSGPWGFFARAVEGGAKVFGAKTAISALEEGEDHGLKQYRDAMDDLDPQSRDLVTRELLPGQEQTHRTMSTIKHSFGS